MHSSHAPSAHPCCDYMCIPWLAELTAVILVQLWLNSQNINVVQLHSIYHRLDRHVCVLHNMDPHAGTAIKFFTNLEVSAMVQKIPRSFTQAPQLSPHPFPSSTNQKALTSGEQTLSCTHMGSHSERPKCTTAARRMHTGERDRHRLCNAAADRSFGSAAVRYWRWFM